MFEFCLCSEGREFNIPCKIPGFWIIYIIVTLDKLVFHKNTHYFFNLAELLITASILCRLIPRGNCEGELGTPNTFKTCNFDPFSINPGEQPASHWTEMCVLVQQCLWLLLSPQGMAPHLRVSGPMNINHYATKKSVAESMLDVALFMANVTQLKAVLEQGTSFQYYATLIVLISISLFFQVLIGILLIITGKAAPRRVQPGRGGRARCPADWLLWGWHGGASSPRAAPWVHPGLGVGGRVVRVTQIGG